MRDFESPTWQENTHGLRRFCSCSNWKRSWWDLFITIKGSVCSSVLQCVCCSVLHCAAVCCSVLKCPAASQSHLSPKKKELVRLVEYKRFRVMSHVITSHVTHIIMSHATHNWGKLRNISSNLWYYYDRGLGVGCREWGVGFEGLMLDLESAFLITSLICWW